MRSLLRNALRAIRRLRNYFKIVELKIKGVDVGFSTTIDSSAGVFPGKGKILIGKRTYLGTGVILRTFGGSITIGSNCSLHPYCVLDGGGGLIIGDNVRIATDTKISASNHVFCDPDELICNQGLSLRGISIENDVWIGSGVCVLDGVRIREGSVIGAGSVVTKSTEPLSVSAGVPARQISSRTRGGKVPCADLVEAAQRIGS